jgi:hypothetical protein
MSAPTITRYEQACREACSYCEAGEERITGLGPIPFADGCTYHSAKKNYWDMPLCTAPTLEAWGEQQAERLAEVEAQLQEYKDEKWCFNKDHERIVPIAIRMVKAEALNRELVDLAQKMAGFVKPYGLSDEGASSEFDQWKICRDRIGALARADTAKEKP